MKITRLPQRFSIDTENGMCPDRKIRTVLIQICSVDALTEDAVELFIGEDCYDQFLDMFDHNDEKKIEGFLFNNKWESKGFIQSIIDHGYMFKESVNGKTSSIGKMEWTCVADDKQTYSIVLRNANGCLWKITDDYLKVIGHSMSEATEMVRTEYPDWWPKHFKDTKLKIPQSMYNNWYTLDPSDKRYRFFIQYSILDSFSQAMLARWLDISGMHGALTSASNGLELSLLITYAGINELKDAEYIDKKNAMNKFLKKHPVLARREQDIVEKSLLGGFVYGHVSLEGRIKGVFCHIDYKSSYPYEYVYGMLPIACKDGQPCHVYVKGTEKYEYTMSHTDNKCLWYYVSFKFKLKDNRMPCLSAESCYDSSIEKDFKSNKNKKMRYGEVKEKLFTKDLYEEIKEHYEVWDEDIHEVWVAPARVGEFSSFIKKCFMEKERPELKGKLARAMWKLFMNGGVHGKTITKTRRTRVTYPGNVKMTEKPTDAGYEPSEPAYCALIGFTAMQNARARLLKHCRMLMEAGYTIMMCDTDSIIVNTGEQNVRDVLGDWFVNGELEGEAGIQNLGKFEFETNEDMLKRIYGERDGVKMWRKEQVRIEFDELSCGGLKEYAEYDYSTGSCELRKSAMKGMTDENQLSVLPKVNMELGSCVKWTQKQKIWNGEAYELRDVEKQSVVRSIYMEESQKTKRKVKFKEKDVGI